MEKRTEMIESVFSTPEYLLNLAIQYLNSEQLIESISILEKIINIYPEYGPAYNYLGWISFSYLQNPNEAEKLYEKAVALSPEYPLTFVNYSRLLNYLNKHEKLSEIIATALKNPSVNQAKIYEEQGKMYEQKNQISKAINSYKQALIKSLEIAEVEGIIDHIDRCNLKLEFQLD